MYHPSQLLVRIETIYVCKTFRVEPGKDLTNRCCYVLGEIKQKWALVVVKEHEVCKETSMGLNPISVIYQLCDLEQVTYLL